MPRVFISYSHDDDAHQQRVYALAERLKGDGVDLVIDRNCKAGGPDEGWDKWSEQQADRVEIVLPVFTPAYRRCWDGEPPPGMRLGAIHELKVLYRRLYKAGSAIDFCRILTFEDDHKNCIPTFLQGLHVFHAPRDYADLLAWLQEKGAAPSPACNRVALTWPAHPVDYQWPLADRLEAFAAFQNMVTQPGAQQILLIEGPGNTGKSALSSELHRYAKTLGVRVVLLDLKGCPSLGELFELLALEVDARMLPAFHSASGTARKTALLKDLENLRAPLLLIFDTYQQVAADITDWIEGQFLRRAEHCPGLRVLIAGQQTPDPTHFPWNRVALKQPLYPIREKHHWLEYVVRVLRCPQISEDHIEALLHVSQGDPGQTSGLLRSFVGAKVTG